MSILPSIELANLWYPIPGYIATSSGTKKRKVTDKHVRLTVPFLYPRYAATAADITKRAADFDSQLIRKVMAEQRARDVQERQKCLLRRSRSFSPCP